MALKKILTCKRQIQVTTSTVFQPVLSTMSSEKEEEGEEQRSGYCYTACCHGDTNTKLNGKANTWEKGSAEDNAHVGWRRWIDVCGCLYRFTYFSF